MAVRASSPDPRVRCNGSHDEPMGEPRWDLATTLLVTDLDGTLLGPEPSLSRRSISVVNNLITRGGAFSYATARSFTSASVLTAGLALQLPVATYGGAVIVDPRTGRRLGSRMLPADVVRSAVANAAPQVRSAASTVIGANTDDGVAEWIAQWLEHGG